VSKTPSVIAGAAVLVLAAVPAYWLYQTNTRLKQENVSLRQQMERDTAELRGENARLSNEWKRASISPSKPLSNDTSELLRLRGEVGRLTSENAKATAEARSRPSALSGITANPETRKMLRAQQKMGMSAIYGGFAKSMSLTKEQADAFNELLADHVMANVDHITTVLKDRLSPQQAEALFKGEQLALKEKLSSTLSADAATQFESYSQELASKLTSEQFRTMLSGEREKKDSQSKQLFDLMKSETAVALTAAGLPTDFQTTPSLNFSNFASETEAEKNLQLLKLIYDQVAAKAGSFLSAEELAKFKEFAALAISNNRAALELNRKMMAPPAAP